MSIGTLFPTVNTQNLDLEKPPLSANPNLQHSIMRFRGELSSQIMGQGGKVQI